MSRYDAVIVGGGIVGTLIALRLAERGQHVALIERGEAGAEQSSRAWGFIRLFGRAGHFDIATRAMELWQELARASNNQIGFKQNGYLRLYASDDPPHLAQQQYPENSALLGDLEYLDRRQLQERFPQLGRFHNALYSPHDAWAEPRESMRYLRALLARASVNVFENTAVSRLVRANDRITGAITERGGEITSREFIICAGSGSRKLLQSIGISIPILCIRSNVAKLRLSDHAQSWPADMPMVVAPDFAARSAEHGEVLVGNGHRRWRVQHPISRDSVRLLPCFYSTLWNYFSNIEPRLIWPSQRDSVDRRTIERNKRALFVGIGTPPGNACELETWSGIIDMTPDAMPIIDIRLDGTNLSVLTGTSGHGFGIAPAIAEAAAASLAGEKPAVDITPFGMERFR